MKLTKHSFRLPSASVCFVPGALHANTMMLEFVLQSGVKTSEPRSVADDGMADSRSAKMPH